MDAKNRGHQYRLQRRQPVAPCFLQPPFDADRSRLSLSVTSATVACDRSSLCVITASCSFVGFCNDLGSATKQLHAHEVRIASCSCRHSSCLRSFQFSNASESCSFRISETVQLSLTLWIASHACYRTLASSSISSECAAYSFSSCELAANSWSLIAFWFICSIAQA
jgi:hypothetical protein